MDCVTPGFLVLRNLPESAHIHDHWVDDAIQPSCLCRPLLLSPSIFLSIQEFFSESALLIRWPKYWSLSFSNGPSSKYSGSIFFRMDWFHLLVVQGTLKSLLQHRNSKASILWCLALFMVQLLHPYMTPGKNIPWAIRRHVRLFYGLLIHFLIIKYLLTPYYPVMQQRMGSWRPRPARPSVHQRRVVIHV